MYGLVANLHSPFYVSWGIGLMRLAWLVVFLLLGSSLRLNAQSTKPNLVVEKDGYPSGHATPEGAACDLARAFIKHDAVLFKDTCIKPFGGGENQKTYAAFLKQMVQAMNEEGKKVSPSPGGPKAIGKVYAARHLSKNGPASFGYAAFGFKDIKFVDVGALLQDGKRRLNRTLVIQQPDGKWYVHPLPSSSPLLSDGLNEEPASTKDFTEAYTIKPALTEDQILAIARKAVAANDTWGDHAEFEKPQRNGKGWSVLVWRLPKTPGGHRDILIDETGRVTKYIRGR